jgi:hypothetical protein
MQPFFIEKLMDAKIAMASYNKAFGNMVSAVSNNEH